MSLQKIRENQPLVHCITNTVVTNFTANGLLAIGASPIMADEVEEVGEIVSLANSLLVNIGTLNARTIASMEVAIATAYNKGIPIVFDPVGAGASEFRLQTSHRILETNRVSLIRCNAGELAAIAGVKWQSIGVDSGSGDADIKAVAKAVANRYRCLVIVTGAEDVLTDGKHVEIISGGNEKVTRITGSGCLLSAICAALLASSNRPLEDLQVLLQQYKAIAERAVGPIGTYQIELLNGLEQMAEVPV